MSETKSLGAFSWKISFFIGLYNISQRSSGYTDTIRTFDGTLYYIVDIHMADNLIAQNFAACLDNARLISIIDSNKRSCYPSARGSGDILPIISVRSSVNSLANESPPMKENVG